MGQQEAKFGLHELPVFVVIGVCGGLLGALFNHLNGRVNRFRRALFSADCCACRVVGLRTLKVLEAMFLAWLVATCFFVVPLFTPCSSVVDAIAGNGTTGSGALSVDEEAAGAAAELAESFLVAFHCTEEHAYNQVASITLNVRSLHPLALALSPSLFAPR